MEELKIFGSCETVGFGIREVRPPYHDGLKHCGYCGSLEPVELAELIKAGKAILHGSDWKYGYPHKFYVDVENLMTGQIVDMGGKSYTDENGIRQNEPDMRPAPTMCHSKFYTNHLGLLDDETFDKVAPIISNACGITFTRECNGEKGLFYSTPYHNYQKPWTLFHRVHWHANIRAVASQGKTVFIITHRDNALQLANNENQNRERDNYKGIKFFACTQMVRWFLFLSIWISFVFLVVRI
jgi:hypothetical protein